MYCPVSCKCNPCIVINILASISRAVYNYIPGTLYGQGVYFAKRSETSIAYAREGQMFQARVLVGEHTRGNSSMKMPPNKPGSHRPYDSLCDNLFIPKMFIIFHDTQAYPEYLLTL